MRTLHTHVAAAWTSSRDVEHARGGGGLRTSHARRVHFAVWKCGCGPAHETYTGSAMGAAHVRRTRDVSTHRDARKWSTSSRAPPCYLDSIWTTIRFSTGSYDSAGPIDPAVPNDRQRRTIRRSRTIIQHCAAPERHSTLPTFAKVAIHFARWVL